MTAGRVKRLIDAELKVNDTVTEAISVPSVTGHILHLSNVAVGDTNEERTGNWIKPTTLMGTMSIQGNPDNVDSLTQYRLFVVMWKENEDVDPISLAKVVQDTGMPFQQYNIESKGSFKILWSRTGNLINNDDNSQFVKYHRFYVKPTMKVLYDGSDFRKYHLFFIAYSNIASGAGPPFLSLNTRLRYTDS